MKTVTLEKHDGTKLAFELDSLLLHFGGTDCYARTPGCRNHLIAGTPAEVIAKLHRATCGPEGVTVEGILKALPRLSTPKHPACIHLYDDGEGGVFVKSYSVPFNLYGRGERNLLRIIESVQAPEPEPPAETQALLADVLRHLNEVELWAGAMPSSKLPPSTALMARIRKLAKEKPGT